MAEITDAPNGTVELLLLKGSGVDSDGERLSRVCAAQSTAWQLPRSREQAPLGGTAGDGGAAAGPSPAGRRREEAAGLGRAGLGRATSRRGGTGRD